MKRRPPAQPSLLNALPKGETVERWQDAVPEIGEPFARLGECWSLIPQAPAAEQQDLHTLYRGAHAKQLLIGVRLRHGCSIEDAAAAIVDLLRFVADVDACIRKSAGVAP